MTPITDELTFEITTIEQGIKMKTARLIIAIAFALSGCGTLPHGGEIQPIVDEYTQKIEFAQSAISYAQCLSKIPLPEDVMEDPENQALQQQIPQFIQTVLEERIISEQLINRTYTQCSDPGAFAISCIECPADGPHTNRCPRVMVTYPSFEDFITESQGLIESLNARSASGTLSISSDDAEYEVIEKHEQDYPLGSSLFGAQQPSYTRYVLGTLEGQNEFSQLASLTSKLALQGSYFSDELDYQSIYECSNIDGVYDQRFSGTENLSYEEARNVVDFSTMSIEERKISSLDRLDEAYKRFDDARDTINALNRIF